MSGIKALEKLRNLKTFGSVKVNSDLVATTMLMVCASMDEINEIADEIEAEIANRYMLLPVDADGVPIHVGDELITNSGVKLKIHVIHLVDDAWWCGEFEGVRYIATACRHVKPRTLEDVLRDVWKEALDYAKSDMWRNPDEVFAERADEIRELLGGGVE